MQYLRSLFGEFCPDPADVEARSYLVMMLYVGDRLVTVDHGGLRRDEVFEHAKAFLLA